MFPRTRLIDLSVPLEHNAISEPLPGSIHYVEHTTEGLAQMSQFFGVRPEDLVYSNGEGWAIEELRMISHTGTHVDAPYHYGRTAAGLPAKRIDEVKCRSNGALLPASSSTCDTSNPVTRSPSPTCKPNCNASTINSSRSTSR